MTALLLYPLWTAALYYLGSRAVITSFIWSRYPKKLAKFMDCSACAGTWYGLIAGLIGGYWLDLPFGSLPGNQIGTVVAVAVASMVWTPIISEKMDQALRQLGSAVLDEEETKAEENLK